MLTDYEVKLKLRNELLIDNPVIFDIGANRGGDTLDFVDVFPTCEIYAFEPDPENYKILLDVVSGFMNAKKISNIFTIECAISNRNGRAKFIPSNNNGLSGSLKLPKSHIDVYPSVKFSENIEVNISTLDSFVSAFEIEHIDIVHMDVQGSELEVIEGGKDTFSNRVRYIFTEFSKTELYEGAPTLGQILEVLPEFEVVEITWQWEHDGNALLKRNGL